MTKVAYELPKNFKPSEPKLRAAGRLRSLADERLCVETKNMRAELDSCDSRDSRQRQYFLYSHLNELRVGNMCLDVAQYDTQIKLVECHGYHGNQEFKYDKKTLLIRHSMSDLCVDTDVKRKKVLMNLCDENAPRQRFKFEFQNDFMI